MGPRAEKSNVHLRRDDKKKIEQIKARKAEYVAKGLSADEAMERAQRDFRRD